ncbi:MAG: hypothetical protein HGA97_01165 [Chlorobiaceae bacterium]|nr:hypothetical protein [Chlorobiaceae bacterium]
MLIYANAFSFDPDNGPKDIVDVFARWAGKKARCYVDSDRLSEGIHELKLPEGIVLNSRVTRDEEKNMVYPYYFSARLSHKDKSVSGRKWITEIGLNQDSSEDFVECSILLRTEEISARVVAPIQVTRPMLVPMLIKCCNPVERTPGLEAKSLDRWNAVEFYNEIENTARRYPFVLVSCDEDGVFPVDLKGLRSILVGLADVVEIPWGIDTYELEAVLGRRYIAFGGAINILFLPRMREGEVFCENSLLKSTWISELQAEGKDIANEVLGLITHRTNLPYSWRHISPETVSAAILRFRLTRAIERSKINDGVSDLSEYVSLLEEADRELQSKDEDIAELRKELEEREVEILKLESDIAGLKYALSNRQSSMSDDILSVPHGLRFEITTAIVKDVELAQGLKIIAALFSDRIVVLESAFNSAKESDRAGFHHGKKAFELLLRLAGNYWEALAERKGDRVAKSVFGQDVYAANEASCLSGEGEKRRTFYYNGAPCVMLKHIKHGRKDSLAETLRIHFEWFASEQKIVIGHCGKHLDF